ncbi:MAG: tyrosine-type recombinase/integrase, partial [Planctomycetota bacterium]
ELDLKAGWWEMPRDRTKAARAQRVPLTRLALAEVKACPRGDSWVFPSFKGQALKVMALSHAVRHNREHFGIERWTPHDLRRTAASHLAALGTDRFTLARILNHADREVTGVYDRYTYDEEKRRALRKWDRRLQAIVSGEAPQEDRIASIDAGRG